MHTHTLLHTVRNLMYRNQPTTNTDVDTDARPTEEFPAPPPEFFDG